MENAKPEDFEGWRAGAHTDFDCLTLLHQTHRPGRLAGLPRATTGGRARMDGCGSRDGVITCNIGDMLMRWSDDLLQSNAAPGAHAAPDEYLGPRYSMPFFAQANRDFVLQGPEKKYPAITAGDYIVERIKANYDALKARS
jgi:isopenicillin N synthase-like dioxygenase